MWGGGRVRVPTKDKQMRELTNGLPRDSHLHPRFFLFPFPEGPIPKKLEEISNLRASPLDSLLAWHKTKNRWKTVFCFVWCTGVTLMMYKWVCGWRGGKGMRLNKVTGFDGFPYPRPELIFIVIKILHRLMIYQYQQYINQPVEQQQQQQQPVSMSVNYTFDQPVIYSTARSIKLEFFFFFKVQSIRRWLYSTNKSVSHSKSCMFNQTVSHSTDLSIKLNHGVLGHSISRWHRLVGLMVKASTTRAEHPVFQFHLRRDFPGRVIPAT